MTALPPDQRPTPQVQQYAQAQQYPQAQQYSHTQQQVAVQYPGQQYVLPTTGYVAPRATNALAIVSFVGAFFVSLVGIICGHIALSQIKRTGEGGKGFAVAGLVIGYISIGAALLVFLFWIILMISMGSAAVAFSSASTL